MTPAQMLKSLTEPVKKCEPCDSAASWYKDFESATSKAVLDFAKQNNLTAFQCVKKKFCPICGRRGSLEDDTAQAHLEWFDCSGDKTHTFVIDKDAEEADRIS
jgi:hypothetical protein